MSRSKVFLSYSDWILKSELGFSTERFPTVLFYAAFLLPRFSKRCPGSNGAAGKLEVVSMIINVVGERERYIAAENTDGSALEADGAFPISFVRGDLNIDWRNNIPATQNSPPTRERDRGNMS